MKFSQEADVSIPPASAERRLGIRYADWRRFKRAVDDLARQPTVRWPRTAWAVLFGFAGSTLASMGTLLVAPEGLPQWLCPAYVATFLAAFILGWGFVFLERQLGDDRGTSVGSICKDLEEIEASFADESTEALVDEPNATDARAETLFVERPQKGLATASATGGGKEPPAPGPETVREIVRSYRVPTVLRKDGSPVLFVLDFDPKDSLCVQESEADKTRTLRVRVWNLSIRTYEHVRVVLTRIDPSDSGVIGEFFPEANTKSIDFRATPSPDAPCAYVDVLLQQRHHTGEGVWYSQQLCHRNAVGLSEMLRPKRMSLMLKSQSSGVELSFTQDPSGRLDIVRQRPLTDDS